MAAAQVLDTQGWADARLLLVTPHPDDESLALGGLIQHALAAGASLRVLQLTDGDNNPWPQRWLEHRWRIGATDRARWGARRAGEVRVALARLGVPQEALIRLGWPDMGVTGKLVAEKTAAVERIAQELRTFAPTHVVIPDLADRHPDHGSAHVAVRLALARAHLAPRCLTYLVHGKSRAATPAYVLPLDDAMRETKRAAVLEHVTQVALARRRLLAMVGPQEKFHVVMPATDAAMPRRVVLPWQPSPALRPWLRLMLAHPDGVSAWAWRKAPMARQADGWYLSLPDAVLCGPVFVRLELRCASLWIFDHWGWYELTATA
ncbi:MAG TPA: PIG-L family deacetylase [Rhodanobacteraceae bacterium]